MITFIPHGTSDNEHSEGKDGTKDGATNISGFPVLVVDCELPGVEYSLIKHFKSRIKNILVK